MLDIELPAVEKPIIMSSVEAALNLANHEIEGLKLEASTEAYINKLQDLNHLRTHSVTTGVSSLEHAIHTAYISDRAAVNTPWKSNVHLTHGLENFNPTLGKMKFEANALKQLDASIEAAETSFMDTMKKVLEWFKSLPGKIMDFFKSNTKRIESIESKLDSAGEGKIELTAKQVAALNVSAFSDIINKVKSFQTDANVAIHEFDVIINEATGLVEKFKSEDHEDMDKDFDEIYQKVKPGLGKYFDSMFKSIGASASSEIDGYISKIDIPSGQEIVVSMKGDIKSAETASEASSVLSSVKISSREKQGYQGKTIDALSKTDVEAILKSAKELTEFNFDDSSYVSKTFAKVLDIGTKLDAAIARKAWKKFSVNFINILFKLYTQIWNQVTTMAKGALTEHLKIAEMSVAGKAPEAKEGE